MGVSGPITNGSVAATAGVCAPFGRATASSGRGTADVFAGIKEATFVPCGKSTSGCSREMRNVVAPTFGLIGEASSGSTQCAEKAFESTSNTSAQTVDTVTMPAANKTGALTTSATDDSTKPVIGSFSDTTEFSLKQITGPLCGLTGDGLQVSFDQVTKPASEAVTYGSNSSTKASKPAVESTYAVAIKIADTLDNMTDTVTIPLLKATGESTELVLGTGALSSQGSTKVLEFPSKSTVFGCAQVESSAQGTLVASDTLASRSLETVSYMTTHPIEQGTSLESTMPKSMREEAFPNRARETTELDSLRRIMGITAGGDPAKALKVLKPLMNKLAAFADVTYAQRSQQFPPTLNRLIEAYKASQPQTPDVHQLEQLIQAAITPRAQTSPIRNVLLNAVVGSSIVGRYAHNLRPLIPEPVESKNLLKKLKFVYQNARASQAEQFGHFQISSLTRSYLKSVITLGVRS